jgi:hypothetical protein
MLMLVLLFSAANLLIFEPDLLGRLLVLLVLLLKLAPVKDGLRALLA